MLAPPRSLQSRLWGGAEPSQVGSIPIHPRHNRWDCLRCRAQYLVLTGMPLTLAGFGGEAGNEAFDSHKPLMGQRSDSDPGA